jgi:L-amino acid N-acyltransferase YncA
MEKKVKLKDQSEVVIREMRPDDLERSLVFFEALPEEDRAFLRRRVVGREFVEWRMQTLKSGAVMRLVAVAGDQIVADGALELETESWKEHVGEIRLIVARPFQNKGLGKLMARELYLLANSKQVEEIVVKVMGPQTGVQKMFERLGFHKEAELQDYVKDRRGAKQNLILMRCKLEELWQKMDDYLGRSDWRRSR